MAFGEATGFGHRDILKSISISWKSSSGKPSQRDTRKKKKQKTKTANLDWPAFAMSTGGIPSLAELQMCPGWCVVSAQFG